MRDVANGCVRKPLPKPIEQKNILATVGDERYDETWAPSGSSIPKQLVQHAAEEKEKDVRDPSVDEQEDIE